MKWTGFVIIAGAVAFCACGGSGPSGPRATDAPGGDDALVDTGADAPADFGADSTTPDAPVPDLGVPIPATDEVQYLGFGIDVPGYVDQTGPGAGDVKAMFAVLDAGVAGLVQRIGATGDGKTRKLGFMLVMPVWLIDAAFPGKIKTIFEGAAQVALARGVAFHVSIESHYSWETRPDLWNFFDPKKPAYDPAHVDNVEWTDWARTGFRWRFLNWGSPQALPAPHMCYLSAAVQGEVARLGGAVGTAARAAMDTLAAAGHPELFSGITVDSEPSLDNYTVIDTVDPGVGQLMSQVGAPKARLGYCSFTAMGYSAANPPPDLGAAAAEANQRFIQSWARAIADAGVPTSRLYTHVAAIPDGSPQLEFNNAPVSIAFIDSARPGWTSYPVGALDNGLKPLLDVVAAHGSPHWGSTEAAPFNPASASHAVDAYEYLRWHYAAGATVVVMNVGATGDLGSYLQNAVYGPAAIAAYQRFLAGQ